MKFLFNEISHVVSDLQVTFQHISRFANGMADCIDLVIEAPLLCSVRLVHFSCTSSTMDGVLVFLS